MLFGMATSPDCQFALIRVGEVPCLVVSGALRSSLADALDGRKFPSAGRRLIVDLRSVELADSVGAQALARFLPRKRAVCILPNGWCAGRGLLTDALKDFPLRISPTELSRTAARVVSSPGQVRHHLRRAVRVSARLLSRRAAQEITVLDVSLGGASFERQPSSGQATERMALLPGEKVQLDLAGSRIGARVVRIGLPGRIGIAFNRTQRALPLARAV